MRQLLAVAVGLVVLAAACSTPAAPRSDAPPATPAGPATLPAPTGTHPVGTTTRYPTDTSRPDPWNLDAPVRELVVTLWYPTAQREGERAPYMSARESELLLTGSRIFDVPLDVLSTTRTNAVRDAPPAGEGLPLVVLSPGFTKPVSTLTSLAEDLASRGFVVAGIDHTYESYATTLRDGRVAECLACDVDSDPGFGGGVVRSRAADVSFVLDELTGPCAAPPGCASVDRSRIAMVGQSIGGASALAAMAADPRIRAGVDMDGTTYARIPTDGFDRPFLFLGTEQHVPGGRDTTWDRDWKLLTGWKRWLVLSGADHASFTDLPLLSDVLGIRTPAGALPATRYSELTRAYVGAFLEEHLNGTPQAVLAEAPEAEVMVCTDTCR
ncbi:alpha/beta hydrolase family protein [Pseudonocardia lacus]|uniref:alpha/beta hydrolase family protein n=1 Tax=Pseudonocardia lacus TaxID=2835865 RepID=UPI001BDC90DA|nr:alpha/beta hydrolase [Pseudonocardia lacus]